MFSKVHYVYFLTGVAFYDLLIYCVAAKLPSFQFGNYLPRYLPNTCFGHVLPHCFKFRQCIDADTKTGNSFPVYNHITLVNVPIQTKFPNEDRQFVSYLLE